MKPRRFALRAQVVASLLWISFLCFIGGVQTGHAQSYDLVIAGGRVIDPESTLDAVRNVGIRDGKVAEVTDRPLTGSKTIDAEGLIVSPGFIDLPSHSLELP